MVYTVVFLVLYALRNLMEPVIQPKKKMHHLFEKEKKGIISLLILLLCSLVPAAVVTYLLFKEGPDSVFLYVFGVALFLTGFAGRAAALRELGINYSQDLRCVPGGSLVETGIYSLTRNPIYLFYIIEISGFLLIKFNYISLAAVILLIPVSLYRIKAEEKLLIEKFGVHFEAYMKRTKRLIPYFF
jgi:protein-S-isoprenylcysteine O-methyltransferase Ste14